MEGCSFNNSRAVKFVEEHTFLNFICVTLSHENEAILGKLTNIHKLTQIKNRLKTSQDQLMQIYKRKYFEHSVKRKFFGRN